MRLIFALLVAVISGCVMKPTKVVQTEKREFDLLVDKTQRPLELHEATVVLDARSNFDYGLNKVRGSYHFPWENLAEDRVSGEVMRDKRKAALRLSLNGLQPLTPIVIVGNGPRGQGEEGRLAWTLLYMGFQDVQVAGVAMFRKDWTPNASPPAQNVPVFTVNVREEMQVSIPEFKKMMEDPKGRMQTRTFILDVRGEKEYFNRAKGAKSTPDINAIHMDWKEFYTAEGRPNAGARAKLQSLGITPADRIVTISQHGVRSSAAAYALLALGFSRVQNFTGGWNSVL